MKAKSEYLQDLKEIKEMMTKSSIFISLSGITGLLIGIFAVITAYWFRSRHEGLVTSSVEDGMIYGDAFINDVLIGSSILLFVSLMTSYLMTVYKVPAEDRKIAFINTYKLITEMLVPLMVGGIISLVFLFRGLFIYAPSMTLIFYGMALLMGSKFTKKYIKSLGLLEITLGIFCLIDLNHVFWYWVGGFGVLHIIYGGLMYLKLEK